MLASGSRHDDEEEGSKNEKPLVNEIVDLYRRR
jgi:hypothetical protein